MNKVVIYLILLLLIGFFLWYLQQPRRDVPRFVQLHAERQARIARDLLAEERLHD